MQVYISDFVCW